ncbi:MAG: 2-amino-4-hydroxy-6-hydroxymethyldihydropteridine diphosphokinase, partial [Muribaculaceae bacterium]|nr:2-amino-4-hydroxy-6-hydroxymethyldihydropteridine diphosphokinase [Muribaculaceae bacterium]
YFTPDCHGGERKYMNAVILGRTSLTPDELESTCKEYEAACGRNAEARANGDVPVDVDLVVYDGCVLREKDFRCEFFLKGYRSLHE